MKLFSHIIPHLLLSLVIVCAMFTSGSTAEIDDTTVFVEAFNAYQQKDYLLVIEKCDQLNQVFPDSPLRDVTLLLVARASLKSGDNERAAKSVALFSREFPGSSLKASVEDELKSLAGKYQKGEPLAADKTLQAAARKVRTEKIARERAAELKLEMERAAALKTEQERLARIKLEEERLERERLHAEKLAKASIQAAITLTVHDGHESVPVGAIGTLPVEIANKGKNSDEFLLTVIAANEFNATVTRTGTTDTKSTPVTRLQLAGGETFKGVISFKMPAESVDGLRSMVKIKAVSAQFSDVSFQKDTVVVSSAPLVRVVAKLAKQKVIAGEKIRYRLAILNAGSLSAEKLAIRLKLPQQVEFIGAPETVFTEEPNGILLFKVDKVDSGKLAEINLDVKISENSSTGQELRGQIEVINEKLQKKETFATGTSVVIAAQ
jgi:hypothetical protein